MAQMVCSLANRDDCLACGSWGFDLWARKDVISVQVLLDAGGLWYGGWATAVRCCF
jgi:hypothetical protein